MRRLSERDSELNRRFTGEGESVYSFPPLLLIGSGIMSLSALKGKLLPE